MEKHERKPVQKPEQKQAHESRNKPKTVRVEMLSSSLRLRGAMAKNIDKKRLSANNSHTGRPDPIKQLLFKWEHDSNGFAAIFQNSAKIKRVVGEKIHREIIEKTVIKTVEALPQEIFWRAETIRNALGEKRMNEIMMLAVQSAKNKSPATLLLHASLIQQLIGKPAQEILQKAAENVIHESPWFFVEYFRHIKPVLPSPFLNREMKVASLRLAYFYPFRFLSLKEIIKTHLSAIHYEKLLKRAAEKLLENSPAEIISRYNEIKEFSWAFSLLRQAVKINSSHSLKHLKLNNKEREDLLKATQAGKLLHQIADETLVGNPKRNNTKLLADPALLNLENIQNVWIEEALLKMTFPPNSTLLYTHMKHVSALKVMVARNLFFQNKSIEKVNVINETTRIFKVREQYKNIAIFKNRNVLYVAHLETNEYFDMHRYIFGRSPQLEGIKKQGGNLSFIRPNEKVASIKSAKANMIKKFITTPPPFTFVFDGHGGPDALYLSNGTISGGKIKEGANTIKITVAELRDMYVKRREKYPQTASQEPEKKDILIFSSCFNHSFLRALYEILPRHITKPVAIGASEYGQLAYGVFYSKFGSSFFEDTLNLKSGKSTTFQDVFEGEFKQKLSNPSCYIPDENNIPQQFSQREKRKKAPYRSA